MTKEGKLSTDLATLEIDYEQQEGVKPELVPDIISGILAFQNLGTKTLAQCYNYLSQKEEVEEDEEDEDEDKVEEVVLNIKQSEFISELAELGDSLHINWIKHIPIEIISLSIINILSAPDTKEKLRFALFWSIHSNQANLGFALYLLGLSDKKGFVPPSKGVGRYSMITAAELWERATTDRQPRFLSPFLNH